MIAGVLLGPSLFGLFFPGLQKQLFPPESLKILYVGTLMNARGLMELIILNIGLHKGIILPALFSMMVLMAIVTTFMASPVFEVVYGRWARRKGELGATPKEA